MLGRRCKLAGERVNTELFAKGKGKGAGLLCANNSAERLEIGLKNVTGFLILAKSCITMNKRPMGTVLK